jgi:adenylate cyclase
VGKARYTEALEAFENAYVSSNENRFFLSNLGYAYALAGRTEEARRILTELLELYQTSLVSPYLVAQIYMGLGERDSALSWLETTYDEGHAQILFLNANPGWEPLRSEPRFQALLRKVGLE